MIAIRCAEESFSLTVEYSAECIEEVETFKYLVRMLDRPDGDCPEVRQNSGMARQLWSRLGKLLRREGAEP